MDLRTLKNTPPWDWPEGTGKRLLEILQDDRATDFELLLAAELAGDFTVINDALADALLTLLRRGDQSEKIRGQAAISLGPVLEQADTEGFEDADDCPIVERTFHRIQQSLRQLYVDASVPSEVRRRILEASVRAPEDWHQGAVRAAFSSDDEPWRLTAVFCMRFVRGFDRQILEALNNTNPDIHYEAVRAAGNWEVDAAWPHVAALLTSRETEKPLLLAAIEAIASIRPHETVDILGHLAAANDEDIAAAVDEAMAVAAGLSDEDEDDESNDDELIP